MNTKAGHWTRIKYLFTGKHSITPAESKEGIRIRTFKAVIKDMDELITSQREQLKELSVQNMKYMKVNSDGRMWDMAEKLLMTQLSKPKISKPPLVTDSTNPPDGIQEEAFNPEKIREELKQIPKEILRSEIAKKPKEDMLSALQDRYKFSPEQAEQSYQIALEVVDEN